MTQRSDTEVLARIDASPARRLFAVAVLGGLGLLLMWIAASQSGAFIGRAVLAIAGGGALWSAHRMWSATAAGIVLTQEGLFDTTGLVLARFDQIVAIDRGMFAFKPSNGFMVKLDTPMPGGWAPGMWWRAGRRIGVGGVTSAGEAKATAEILTVMLAERDGTI